MSLVSFEKKQSGGVVRLSGWAERGPQAAPEELRFSFPEDLAAFVANRADPFAGVRRSPRACRVA